MLKFDYTNNPDPDQRPYTVWDGANPARNPITVSMVGKCVRANAYHFRGEPKQKHPNLDAAKTEMTFAVGTAIHEALQRGIVGLEDVEKTIRIGLYETVLEGRIDGLVPVQLPSGETVTALLEMKSMNPYAFKRFKDTEEIDSSYEIQANTYVHMLQQNGREVEHILWVMIDRGSLEVAYSLRKHNSEQAEEGVMNADCAALTRPEDLRRLWSNPNGKLAWQCAYCDFWKSCWPEARAPENGKVELYLGDA
jgi:hypothetical protein